VAYTAEVRTDVLGGHKFHELSKELRAVATDERRGLQRKMNRQIRAAARPVVADVRRAALDIPDRSAATRRDQRSIRREIANATRTEILTGRRAGVRIVVDKRRLPADSTAMAHAFERPQGWRHPVWADPDKTRGDWTWVHQAGHPWFAVTIQPHEGEFRRAVLDAMDETAAEIDRALGR
jgi:hypothetical protein